MSYKLRDFLPLIVIFTLILAFTCVHQMYVGFTWMGAMRDFMGSFFLVFGTFKLLNLSGFAKAYQIYDLVAQRSVVYAYAYPFLEIGLGIAYFTRFMPKITNVFTLVLMSVSALGVFNELRKGKQIVCACLGVVFKIPMTYVTLMEDVLMAGMALVMLLD